MQRGGSVHLGTVHAPQVPEELQVRAPPVQVPAQFAQIPVGSQPALLTAPGVQAQGPFAHWHDAEQVSVSLPVRPSESMHASLRVLLAAQTPWPEQVPAVHWQDALHTSLSVPQLPHATV